LLKQAARSKSARVAPSSGNATLLSNSIPTMAAASSTRVKARIHFVLCVEDIGWWWMNFPLMVPFIISRRGCE